MKKIIAVLLLGTLVSLFTAVGPFLSCGAVIILFIVLLFTVTNLIWTLLPQGARRTFKNNKKRFVSIILPCLIFFFFGGVAFNHWLHPDSLLPPIRSLSNAGVLVFTIFLGRCLIKPGKKKVLSIGAIIFILFIFSLAIMAAKNRRHILPSAIERLKSLPYLTWVPAENIEKIGVTQYKRSLAYAGFNIYITYNSSLAYLIDMSGKILHTWSIGPDLWQVVEMCGNGDLLGISYGAGNSSLVRLDWDSQVRWKKEINVLHHDIAVAKNKDIYALAKNPEIVSHRGLPLPIINDYIIVLSADGKIKKELSLYKILKKEIPPDKFIQAYRWWRKEWKHKFALWKMTLNPPKQALKLMALKLIGIKMNFGPPSLSLMPYYNIFHTNTIKIINRDIPGLCQEGDVLICMRDLNLIKIIDIKNEKIIWSWGPGNLDLPHNPTLLENGNILIFDNGSTRGYSRIVELEPMTKNIVWEYKTNPPEQFYSRDRGSSQRLPNGNTLITESNAGRVFEITQEGEMVWEFYSPEVDMQSKKRKTIYRMVRITDPQNYPFLKELK